MVDLTYSPLGGTLGADFVVPYGFRANEGSARVGKGAARWEFASREVLTWGVKRRSGFRVDASRVREGEDVTVIFGWGPFSVREPVRVVQVVDAGRRRGFAYGTLPGHPIRGEESFVVEHREDDSVWITVRSFSQAGTDGWRLAYPLLRVAQRFFTRRYLRSLAGPIE